MAFIKEVLYGDINWRAVSTLMGLPRWLSGSGDTSPIPGLGRSPGGGHGNPLQYSCLENPMDRGTIGFSVLCNPGIELQSPALQADSLPPEL